MGYARGGGFLPHNPRRRRRRRRGGGDAEDVRHRRREEGPKTTMPPIPGGTRRCHFHEFMLDVHGRIHRHKLGNPKSDPIPPVAASLAREARLLCLDEMQITDIADAMIMRRLMTTLLDLGVVVVTTSNRPPWLLYEGGINRGAFLPLIDTLKERMVVIGMGGEHDYRRDAVDADDDDDGGAGGGSSSSSPSSPSPLPRYLCPSVDPSPDSRKDILERWFASGGGVSRIETLPVAMGRSMIVSRANDKCAIFAFAELCDRPLGAADYIAIMSRYENVVVSNVPRLTGDVYDQARRFVVLVDAAYESRTRLILDAEVDRDDLFVGFDADVTTNDGDEEIAVEEDSASGTIATTSTTTTKASRTFGGGGGGNGDTTVVGEGGSSSSSSTTFFRTGDGGGGRVEWSATGRVGVSLAQLSAVREVSFSFKRAESRLAEMASSRWGR